MQIFYGIVLIQDPLILRQGIPEVGGMLSDEQDQEQDGDQSQYKASFHADVQRF